MAFCTGHAAEIEAAKHPAETFDSWKPKRGSSHRRMSNPTNIRIYDWLFFVYNTYRLDSSLQSGSLSGRLLYCFLIPSKFKTHDYRKKDP